MPCFSSFFIDFITLTVNHGKYKATRIKRTRSIRQSITRFQKITCKCSYPFYFCSSGMIDVLFIEDGTINYWLRSSNWWTSNCANSWSTGTIVASRFSIHWRYTTIRSWTNSWTCCSCQRVLSLFLDWFIIKKNVILVLVLLVCSKQLMIYPMFAKLPYLRKALRHVSLPLVCKTHTFNIFFP